MYRQKTVIYLLLGIQMTSVSFVAGDKSFTKTVEQFGSNNPAECFSLPCGFATCSIRLSLLIPTSNSSLRLEHLLVGHSTKEYEAGQVRLGEGCSHSDLILEKCLRTMRRGEQSVLQFHTSLNLSNTAEVKMRVTLDDFTQGEEVWKMSSDELRVEAIRLKEKGVRLYSNDYRSAFVLFSKATKLLIVASQGENEEDKNVDFRSILVSCYSNMAACQLKGEKYEHVVTNCNRALDWADEEEGGGGGTVRMRVLYRRAAAFTVLGQYELAIVDLDAVLRAEPRNEAALRQKKVVLSKTVAVTDSLRVAMKKMFK